MKKGMIKVSVMYPYSVGKNFDMDYYAGPHVSMVVGLLGDAVKGAGIESGLGGAAPGTSAPYMAIGHMYFDSMEAYENSFGPHAETILGDLPNFTDIEPIIQVSVVVA